MKTPSIPSNSMRKAGTLAVIGLLALSPVSQAKDQKGGKGKAKGHSVEKGNQGGKGHEESHGNPHHDRGQADYHSYSDSKFKLYKGDGHAGQGYYYGPPNAPYYYARPGVRFFPNHGAIPREFYNQDAYRMNSDDARVQQALARLGFYRGSIDGRFGPQSMRAMNTYQQSQGQQVTGAITAMLLRSLGL
tara:strand:- start:719 stop:1285 length:567 start_codon:yes stop_codon:yes gene_type:complete